VGARAGVVRGSDLSARSPALRVVLLLVLAGVWAAAVWWLWDSVVPDDLSLPDVQLDGIPQAILDRADRYERFFRVEFVVSQLVLIGVLILYAKHGARFAKESAAGRIGTGMLLGMIGLALVWSSQVPFRLAEVWWDRRYDQTDSGYIETLFSNWLELGAEFLFICFALLVVMALAGKFPRRWWLAAAPFFVGLAALFSFIYPYLTPTEPLRRTDLIAAGREYAAKQGIDPVPLRVEDVTDFTSAPNAYAVGFGPTKRIVFWNTLLDGSFTDNEVKTVLAHELGHLSSGHLIEGIEWYALFALPGAWLIAVATRRRGGMANPAAVPLSLLVIVVLDLLSLPVYNLVSRHMEAEADWKALETTHDPASAEALFKQFTIQSLNDPDPPTWSYLLFDSHPSVEQRIAMAEAWKARSR
jgi:Zn-dependent protease with chaperone function